jgi:tetratricopeptide (TPR) repeat protein
MAKCFAGRAEDTEVHIQEAFRLSPRDTLVYLWHSMAGIAKVFLGRDEEAVGRLRQGIETNRNFAPAQFYLGVALTELGRLGEARIAVKEGLSIDPSFTLRRYRAAAPSDNPIFLSGRERVYKALQKAGVPEG